MSFLDSIGLGSIGNVVPGGLDKLVDVGLPLAATAVLGPAGPLVAQLAAPIAKEILGDSDAVVRDHRPAFQIPTSLAPQGGNLVDAFASLEQRKNAAIQGMADPDPVKAFKAKQDFEAANRVEEMLLAADNTNNELQKKIFANIS